MPFLRPNQQCQSTEGKSLGTNGEGLSTRQLANSGLPGKTVKTVSVYVRVTHCCSPGHAVGLSTSRDLRRLYSPPWCGHHAAVTAGSAPAPGSHIVHSNSRAHLGHQSLLHLYHINTLILLQGQVDTQQQLTTPGSSVTAAPVQDQHSWLHSVLPGKKISCRQQGPMHFISL